MKTTKYNFFLLACLSALLSLSIVVQADTIKIGTAIADITPKLPAAVDGQMHLRVAEHIETPLEADVLVLDNQSSEAVVFVTCDLVTIPTELRDLVRDKVKDLMPDFEVEKIIINATHTHTGAVVRNNWYKIPKEVTQVEDYLQFLSGQVAGAIAEAWQNRQAGSMSWGISQAKVAFNRRAVYADGSAIMYGKTNKPDFRGIEGYEDQSINSLFFWDENGQLIATSINVASPAQIAERNSAINADYWHPVRVKLRETFGEDLCVLGWIGAAGDQTPRPMYDSEAESRMFKLQGLDYEGSRGSAYLDEIANRIVKAVDETYEIVKNDLHADIPLVHQVAHFELPMRIVKEEEYAYSKKIRDEDLADVERAEKYHRRITWHQEVLDRYENQKKNSNPMYPVEVHVLRIGDIALCTNPFELFTDYGIQIKARSKALQTFIVQLVGPGTYLPTERAVKGGHYSAIVQSNRVGPEGGEILVEKTVEMINSMWEE